MANRPVTLRATALASLAAVALLAGCSEHKEEKAGAPIGAATDAWVVMAGQTADLRPVAAIYTTRDAADARARIGGTLVSLSVREGDRVRRGQVIGQVRDERLGLQSSAADAQVSAAAAEAGRADADLARTRALFEHGVYAKARLEQAEASAHAADAQLKAAKAQHAASADLVGQGVVLAPASGVVLHAPIPAGSVVSPGQVIATLSAGPPVIRLQLPEAQAGAVKPGQSLQIRGDDGGLTPSGRVLQVYPSVSGGEVTIDLAADPQGEALVGQRIDVLVPVGVRSAIVVPRRMVTTRYGVDYVRLLRTDGAAEDVIVQTAPAAAADQVEILSGLRAGDRIVGAPAGKAMPR